MWICSQESTTVVSRFAESGYWVKLVIWTDIEAMLCFDIRIFLRILKHVYICIGFRIFMLWNPDFMLWNHKYTIFDIRAKKSDIEASKSMIQYPDVIICIGIRILCFEIINKQASISEQKIPISKHQSPWFNIRIFGNRGITVYGKF